MIRLDTLQTLKPTNAAFKNLYSKYNYSYPIKIVKYYSFNKHLLNIYHVSRMVTDDEDTSNEPEKQSPYLLGAYTTLKKRNNCNVSDLA